LGSVSSLLVARIRALWVFEKYAQDGRGIKRPPEGLGSVSSLLVARIRALWVFEKHAQDGRGIKRIRALCAFETQPARTLQ
jgi:hypothetical protein